MKRRLLAIAAIAASSNLAVGCDLSTLLYGDGESAPPVTHPIATQGAQAPWTIDIGTGDTSFVPLADDEAVPKQSGAQGGYHVWVSLRIHGDDAPNEVVVQLTLTDASGALVSRSAQSDGARLDDASTDRTVVGLRGFVAAGTKGKVLIEAKVIDDTNGRWAEASRPVVVM